MEKPGTNRRREGGRRTRDQLFSQPQSSSLAPEIVEVVVTESCCCHDNAVHLDKSGLSSGLKIKLFVRRLILIEQLSA